MKFIIVDKVGGEYLVEGFDGWFQTLSGALKAASDIKSREGGIIANRASAEHRAHDQMSSDNREGNYRVET